MTRSNYLEQKHMPWVRQRAAALLTWSSTILALMVRDVRSRFSGDPIGYGWAFITPLMWIISIAVVFNLIGRHVPIYTDVVSFLIAGMLPYTVFRTTITSTMRALRVNKHMLYFAQIRKIDLLITSALMEVINAFSVYIALLLGNWLFFSNFELANPELALLGFSMAWGLGVSIGHLAAAFMEVSDVILRVIPVILRPMFWISGIFYVGNELPDYIMQVLQYNPMLQAIEIMRDGTFMNYSSRYADPLIPLAFIVGMNGLAILVKVYAANNRATNPRRIV
jgi:ABC-type polysaccharide/polyol phosphate export permease